MGKKLKRCPFCGGKAFAVEDYPRTDYYIRCDECGVGTPCYPNEFAAIAAWNKRTKKYVYTWRLPNNTHLEIEAKDDAEATDKLYGVIKNQKSLRHVSFIGKKEIVV